MTKRWCIGAGFTGTAFSLLSKQDLISLDPNRSVLTALSLSFIGVVVYPFPQLKMHVGNCKSVCDILVKKDEAGKS